MTRKHPPLSAKQQSQPKFVHGEVVLPNEARNGCLKGNETAEMFCNTLKLYPSLKQSNEQKSV
jgi:hypothetical protein